VNRRSLFTPGHQKAAFNRWHRSVRTITAFTVLLICVLVLSRTARAQSDPIFDAKGFQQNHDYTHDFTFERIDPFIGNVILTFTDFSFPGNGGLDLTWQRVHNSKLQGGWSFGLPGVPMSIGQADLRTVLPGQEPPLPIYFMADGGEHKTFYVVPQNANVVISKEFLRFDRTTHSIAMPNGWTAHYDVLDTTDSTPQNPLGRDTRYLTHLEDRFGNSLNLAYDTTAIPRLTSITHDLQNGQTRLIQLEYESGRLHVLRYGTKTWTYLYAQVGLEFELSDVISPEGTSWHYDYETDRGLVRVATPSGAEVFYTFADHEFPVLQSPPDVVNSRVITHKQTRDLAVTTGDWTYAYSPTSTGQSTAIQGPNNTMTYDFLYGPAGLGSPHTITIADAGGPLSTETFTSEFGPEVGVTPFADDAHLERLAQHLITRNDRPYVTNYVYSASNFGDFNRPFQITETGELTRTTTQTFDYGFTFFVAGPLSAQMVTVGADSYNKSWTYNHATGFQTGETAFGITTTFAPDGLGNVGTVTKANGNATTISYEWGIVKNAYKEQSAVTRTINPEGTVASETRAGRTTTFEYDDLLRIRKIQPPSSESTPSEAVFTDYDPNGRWTRVTRGQSIVTTSLDGFARPISRADNLGVEVRTRYDAEGRMSEEGYPFEGGVENERHVSIAYDGLGRMLRRTNPDATYVEITYGAGTVTNRDENDHATTQTRQAFGNPDQTRLSAVLDANTQTWQYTYDAVGNLRKVAAPDGTERRWVYDTHNLLTQEVHPESGTVYYDDYDGAGNLTAKHDANGTITSYIYDGNDRIRRITAGNRDTTFTYEPGSDNRQSATNDNVNVLWMYDGAGHLKQRQDSIDGKLFVTSYEYDGVDNLVAVVYPSGRRVQYDYNAEHQITRVSEPDANRTYASDITYHPAGGVRTNTAGNGHVTTWTYDPLRYRLQGITSVALQSTYGYDKRRQRGYVRRLTDRE